MIRYTYINNQILHTYQNLKTIKFPIDPIQIISTIPNCRYLSYQKLADISGNTVDQVIQMCDSESGCTHYDRAHDRYLILCNQSTQNHNNTGRQRWTACHELGHILCGHFEISETIKLSENNFALSQYPEFESEADYFAAMTLAPFPLFKLLNIKSPIDIQNTFGLSTEASVYRFQSYIKWKNTRLKTAWENDMIRLYKQSLNDFQ